MKLDFFIKSCFVILLSFFAHPVSAQSAPTVKEVKSLFEKLAPLVVSVGLDFTEEEMPENLVDSIANLNQQIINKLLAKPVLLSNEDLQPLKQTFDIDLVRSADGKVNVYSWETGEDPIARFYNNIIVYTDGRNRPLATLYSGFSNGKQTGDNFSVDEVHPVQGSDVIMLNQSGSCGSACILKRLTTIKITNGNIGDGGKIFRKDDSCVNELRFRYHLSDVLRNELDFQIDTKRNTVVVPQLNNDNTEVISHVGYKIGSCD